VFIAGLEYRPFTPVPEASTWGIAGAMLLNGLIGFRKFRVISRPGV
jgi:hypothetical protein